MHTIDLWVIDIDPDHYAFLYGCGIRSMDGTCQNAHAFKYSRTPQLAPQYHNKMAVAAKRVCLENPFIKFPVYNGEYISFYSKYSHNK